MRCKFCCETITWDERTKLWRDETEDPGDGFGGDTACGGRSWDGWDVAPPHEPERDVRWETIWAGVDPFSLRGWASCRTWAELDYFITARASMDHVNIGYDALQDRHVVFEMFKKV